MLDNFIKKYKVTGLNRIAYLFLHRRSNQEIAKEFGVTRQRVHQWQQAFTCTKTTLKPFVETMLRRLN